MTPNGDFNIDGAGLRRKGLNRIGNLVVPNDNYCKFEDWVMPILDKMVEEQEGNGTEDGQRARWTPSKVIDRLGKEINDESSILYWAHKVTSKLLGRFRLLGLNADTVSCSRTKSPSSAQP